MSIILSFCKSNTFFLKTCKSNIFSICESHTFYLRYIIVIPRFYIYSNIFPHWLCIILLSNSPPFHRINQSLHWLHFDHFREPSTQSTRTLLLLQKRKLTVPVNLYVFFFSFSPNFSIKLNLIFYIQKRIFIIPENESVIFLQIIFEPTQAKEIWGIGFSVKEFRLVMVGEELKATDWHRTGQDRVKKKI